MYTHNKIIVHNNYYLLEIAGVYVHISNSQVKENINLGT